MKGNYIILKKSICFYKNLLTEPRIEKGTLLTAKRNLGLSNEMDSTDEQNNIETKKNSTGEQTKFRFV